MSEHRFFADIPAGGPVVLEGADARHIRAVLRLGPGDGITVCDRAGCVYSVEITRAGRDRVEGRIRSTLQASESVRASDPLRAAGPLRARPQLRAPDRIPAPDLTLFQGLPRAAKMDQVVRQATELGVAGVVPVLSSRVVAGRGRDAPVSAARVERWRRIAREASKQARRSSIPEVSHPVTWPDALELLAGYDRVVVFWEEADAGRPGLEEALQEDASRIAIVIGPEGGFSGAEVDRLIQLACASTISLPTPILRTETAAVASIAMVQQVIAARRPGMRWR